MRISMKKSVFFLVAIIVTSVTTYAQNIIGHLVDSTEVDSIYSLTWRYLESIDSIRDHEKYDLYIIYGNDIIEGEIDAKTRDEEYYLSGDFLRQLDSLKHNGQPERRKWFFYPCIVILHDTVNDLIYEICGDYRFPSRFSGTSMERNLKIREVYNYRYYKYVSHLLKNHIVDCVFIYPSHYNGHEVVPMDSFLFATKNDDFYVITIDEKLAPALYSIENIMYYHPDMLFGIEKKNE